MLGFLSRSECEVPFFLRVTFDDDHAKGGYHTSSFSQISDLMGGNKTNDSPDIHS